MTAVASLDVGLPRRAGLPLSLRLAWRDLRGGISGFYVLVACIALGVGAIATVNSLSLALESAIEREGQILLGGDMNASLMHRQATSDERAQLERWGMVSEVATLRGMARLIDGSRQSLIDIKAVDEAYPLFGSLTLRGGVKLAEALKQGIAIDENLAAQLNVKPGDRLAIGQARPVIAAIIASEPDRLSSGPAFGPRVLMSVSRLAETRLIQPGSLIRWHYRIKLDAGRSIQNFEGEAAKTLAASGFEIRDRNDPSPGINRSIERLRSFLTLAGLTALLTGGIGVANAVAAFVERKRRVIAIYKALGASRRLVNSATLIEVLLLAGVGVVIGLVIGGMAPLITAATAGQFLPFAIDVGFQWRAALLAALFGLLTALGFILWPLGRANEIRAAELLRETVSPSRSWPPGSFLLASLASGVSLGATAILASTDRLIAAGVCLAMVAVFGLFWGVAILLRSAARKLPRLRRPEVALALGNIARPGGLTATVSISLGTGLMLLTAIALIGASLGQELSARLPEKAPSHFFLSIPKRDIENFAKLIAETAPGAELSRAPMLRGRIVRLAGKAAEEIKAPERAAWVLNGDRGLTFEANLPKDSQLVEGSWWQPDYSGPPLVSFEVDLGKALGLKIGDIITVNVLGRNIEARLANFRTVKWESLDINFVMIFSPNTLADAPYGVLATLNWPAPHSAEDEARLAKAVTEKFPTVTILRVRDAIETVNKLLGRLLTAVQAAAGVTLAVGVLVLAGALAAAQRRRIYEAVILKTLGATRFRIIAAHMFEMAVIAVVVGLAATLTGALAAYIITTEILRVEFILSLDKLLQASLITAILMLVFGGFGTWRVLSAKAAPYLRSE